ncbi:MAG: hypothetical protein ACREA9_29620, partial [Pyrinomonadaceae bacterium]
PFGNGRSNLKRPDNNCNWQGRQERFLARTSFEEYLPFSAFTSAWFPNLWLVAGAPQKSLLVLWLQT